MTINLTSDTDSKPPCTATGNQQLVHSENAAGPSAVDQQVPIEVANVTASVTVEAEPIAVVEHNIQIEQIEPNEPIMPIKPIEPIINNKIECKGFALWRNDPLDKFEVFPETFGAYDKKDDESDDEGDDEDDEDAEDDEDDDKYDNVEPEKSTSTDKKRRRDRKRSSKDNKNDDSDSDDGGIRKKRSHRAYISPKIGISPLALQRLPEAKSSSAQPLSTVAAGDHTTRPASSMPSSRIRSDLVADCIAYACNLHYDISCDQILRHFGDRPAGLLQVLIGSVGSHRNTLHTRNAMLLFASRELRQRAFDRVAFTMLRGRCVRLQFEEPPEF